MLGSTVLWFTLSASLAAPPNDAEATLPTRCVPPAKLPPLEPVFPLPVRRPPPPMTTLRVHPRLPEPKPGELLIPEVQAVIDAQRR